MTQGENVNPCPRKKTKKRKFPTQESEENKEKIPNQKSGRKQKKRKENSRSRIGRKQKKYVEQYLNNTELSPSKKNKKRTLNPMKHKANDVESYGTKNKECGVL